MNKAPEKNMEVRPDKNTGEKKNESGWRGLLHVVARFFLHQWPFKLLSLVIAIVLWSGLITQDPTLTREKVFTGVTISVSGEDTIKRNGLIVVSDLDAVTQDAKLRVEVPQMQYANASASNYNARIDLTRIRETGVQEVKVLTTSSSTWGSVIEISPETVEIEVEEYITRYRIPVSVVTVGEAPDGFYAAAPSLDPPQVTVSGPRSLVDRVVRAEAILDLSTLPAREGLMRTSVPFQLLDSDGEVIQSDLLEITSESVLVDSVIAEQYLYAKREIDMSTLGLTRGEPATGYEIKTVTVTPATITAAGWSANLDVLDTLYADSYVDVTGASESLTELIRVRRPSELAYLSSDTVTVAVEIGPVIQSRTFEDLKLSVEGTGSDYESSLTQNRASVTITGPQLWVEGLRSADLSLSCDATGLTAGTYELPIICKVNSSDDVAFDVEVVPRTVQVEITKK